MKVTIGIKALNEEKHIAQSVASAVRAALPFGGEVILADSGSSDRTVEIARQFPIRIVQLANQAERCCGAGAQLAFQHAGGDFFYLLDGDMELNPDFMPAAIDYLDAHPEIAAVGGRVNERNVQGQDFQIRANAQRSEPSWQPGIVDRLDCGGLYRASAVRETGYFADRNLHAFEELDLGARLRSRGWKLARIDLPAVDHFGHTTEAYQLLWRRLQSGYSGGPGEVLRAALGKRHLGLVFRGFGHLRNCIVVILWWALLAAAGLLSPYWLPPLLAAPLIFLGIRRRSLSLGLYSLASWNVSALAAVAGLLHDRVSPTTPLKSVEMPVQKDVKVISIS